MEKVGLSPITLFVPLDPAMPESALFLEFFSFTKTFYFFLIKPVFLKLKAALSVVSVTGPGRPGDGTLPANSDYSPFTVTLCSPVPG